MSIAVGLCSITLRSHPVEEVLAVAVRAGIEAIEWGADVHVRPGATDLAASVARRCSDVGITVPSYGSYLGMGPVTDDDVAPVLDTAAALGTPVVRVWTELGVTPGSPAADRARVAETTARIAGAAAARDLHLALEFHPGTLTHTAASTNALLDAVDRPNLRTHWQPDPTLATSDALDELRAVVPRLEALHVFSWGPAGIADRRPLSAGGDLWPRALALAAGGPGPRPHPALCEYVRGDDPDQVVDDAHTLRRWIDDLAS